MAGLPTPIASGFVSGTFPPATPYATHDISPFNALPISKDHNLLFTFYASVATSITLTWRILLPDGSIKQSQFVVNTFTGRFGPFLTFPLTEGFLLSVMAYPTNNAARGAVALFCNLTLGAPAVAFLVARMFSGYVTGFDYLSWPPGTFESTSNGAGKLRSITGTAPGAGNEINEAVPSFARWRLLALKTIFTSSAVAANRQPSVIIDDGVSIYYAKQAQAVQAANLVQTYQLATNDTDFAPINTVATIKLASPLLLDQGHRIRTSTTAIQAGDFYSAPQYLVEEWIMN